MYREIGLCPIAQRPQVRRLLQVVVGLKTVVSVRIRRKFQSPHPQAVGVCRGAISAVDMHEKCHAEFGWHRDVFVVCNGLRMSKTRPIGAPYGQVQVVCDERPVQKPDEDVQHPVAPGRQTVEVVVALLYLQTFLCYHGIISQDPQVRRRRKAVVWLKTIPRPVDHQVVIRVCRAGVAENTQVIRPVPGNLH